MEEEKFKNLEKEVKNLEKAVNNISSKHDELKKDMGEKFAALNSRLDELFKIQGNRENDEETFSVNQNGNGSKKPTHSTSSSLGPKLKFPEFFGTEDPTSWLCRAEQFFDYHSTPEEEKVPIASFNLDKDAQLWFQLEKQETPIISWEAFKECIQIRYGATEFLDFFGDLTKLQQTGTVKEYQVQFEKLLIRAGKLSQSQQVGCFVSGLKESIRTDVQASKPNSLSAAIGLARLYESRNEQAMAIVNNTEAVVSNTNSTYPVIKKLLPMELKERREKGLCFNCDERFKPGHRCKKLFFIEGIYDDEEGYADIGV